MQAQDEIDSVLGEAEQPDMAGYSALRYLTRCVNESMRLYPHPPVLLRRAELADTLPGASSHPMLSLGSQDLASADYVKITMAANEAQ